MAAFIPGDATHERVEYLYDDVTVAPGGMAVFMHIEHQNASEAAARAFAEDNGDGITRSTQG